MSVKEALALPTLKEIDDMTVFPAGGHECTLLCHALLGDIEELQGATGIKRLRLLATIRAIRNQMRELKCGICLPD